MNFWEKRKIKKVVHHLMHEAHHARHMREDIAAPEKITRIHAGEAALREAWEKEDLSLIDKAADELAGAVHDVYPPHRQPRMRENIEIIVVAIAVAMAFRTYFIQPFRIPTGSMQPTLNGITFTEQPGRKMMDYLPLSAVPFFLFGERYVEYRAKASGGVDRRVERMDENWILRIAGVPHVIPIGMLPESALMSIIGRSFDKNEIIVQGRRQLGDHIFVDRIRYNFSPPQRGDVFVFSTREIRHPDIRPDNYYIKRLVGLPNEQISIQPPYLLADGQVVTNPAAFIRQVEGEGYHGYGLVGDTPIPSILRRPGDVLHLGPDEYLPLGDNTRASLDGRFFGGVKKQSIVGPAFMVYWPFTKRWGLIE